MFAVFSKYLLIGLSAMVLLVGAQNDLFNKQNINLAVADECQQEARDIGNGCAQNYDCNGNPVGDQYNISTGQTCHGTLVSGGGECINGRMRWVNTWSDGWRDIDKTENEYCIGSGTNAQIVSPPSQGAPAGAVVPPSQDSQPVRVDQCTDPNTPQTEPCNDNVGTGHKYCTWTASGNVWSECKIESCNKGELAPPACTQDYASPGNASSQWECERAIAQGRNICDDNITSCEATGWQGDKVVSAVLKSKEQGVCNPNSGMRDSRGCIFQNLNVRGFNYSVPQDAGLFGAASSCPSETVPAQAQGGGQPQQPSGPQQPVQRAGACYLCDGATRRLVSGDGGNFTSEADCRNSGEGNRSFDSNPNICAPVQTCYVCDNTGYADGQGRWRVDGNGCPVNPPVCQADNSATFAGCLNAQVGTICETRATIAPNVPVCQSNGSCSVSTPLVCGQTVVGVDNCLRSCSRSSAVCVTPPQGGNTTVNPVITFNPIISNTNTNTSTNTNSNTNTITNNVSREVVRVVVAPATFGNVGVGQTAYTTYTAPVQYTALPKTGLPELAWSALAFIPTGFGLRRFAKVKKALENHPQFIWEERQFKA